MQNEMLGRGVNNWILLDTCIKCEKFTFSLTALRFKRRALSLWRSARYPLFLILQLLLMKKQENVVE